MLPSCRGSSAISTACTPVTGPTDKTYTCSALVVVGAAAADVAGDGEVAEPADADRGQPFDVDAAPVTLMVPTVSERLYDSSAAGEAFSADHGGRVAEQDLRPDLLHVAAEGEDAG